MDPLEWKSLCDRRWGLSHRKTQTTKTGVTSRKRVRFLHCYMNHVHRRLLRQQVHWDTFAYRKLEQQHDYIDKHLHEHRLPA